MSMPAAAPDPGSLLTRAGPLVDAAEVHAHGDDVWLVYFEDELAVMAEQNSGRDTLVLTAELGLPHAGSEAAVHRHLLEVTARWQQTDGLRMGLDPDDGTVLQITEVALPGLTPEWLGARLTSFVEAVRHGRSVLASLDEHASHAQASIRV